MALNRAPWSNCDGPKTYLEGVLVDQVQGIPGELGATTGVAAHQISILGACIPESATKARAKIPKITYG